MMDADVAARRGLPILGLFRGMQLAAVPPEEMSIAIAPAIRKLMQHHELAMADIDLWELHEAYAVTTLYNQAQLETPWETTNVNGGAVAARPPVRHVGHPLSGLHAPRARPPPRRAARSSACAPPAAWRPPRISSGCEPGRRQGLTRVRSAPLRLATRRRINSRTTAAPRTGLRRHESHPASIASVCRRTDDSAVTATMTAFRVGS